MIRGGGGGGGGGGRGRGGGGGGGGGKKGKSNATKVAIGCSADGEIIQIYHSTDDGFRLNFFIHLERHRKCVPEAGDL